MKEGEDLNSRIKCITVEDVERILRIFDDGTSVEKTMSEELERYVPEIKPAIEQGTEVLARRKSKKKLYHGAGLAYQPWNYKIREWGKMYASENIAKMLGNGVYREVWVWYDKGEAMRVLNREEIVKYCP